MSSIGYVQVAPAGVPPEVATYFAARGAAWCDYSATGAPAKYRETPAALLPLEGWAETIGELKKKHGFELLLDHSAVDYPARKPRFTVVAVLENPTTTVRLLLKTRVEEDAPVPTLTHLFRSADWAERETFDMFGIPFAGHPDLTRIYMPEDYEGWPMRRDFPLEGHLKFRD